MLAAEFKDLIFAMVTTKTTAELQGADRETTFRHRQITIGVCWWAINYL